jgi:peptidoglycan/LPS O-acetylase OafA/YrhL
MTQLPVSSDLLKPKPHFVLLDGLRGVAALAVVLFHFMEWVYPDARHNFIGYGFLAVDFFFCLSGFVIGYAYDDRLGSLGVWAFFQARLIRLHPLVVLGSVLGLLALLLDPFEAYPGGYGAGKLLQAFGCSVLLIPFPVLENRSFNLFGLNAPAWSLFWEYVANIVYALLLYKLARRYLAVLTLLAAATLFLVSYRAGNLLGGWAGENFWDGGARIAYSFCAGLLLYRSNWVLQNNLGFRGLASLLLLAFLMPHVSWNWVAEPLVVVAYFPFLVALGAGARASLSAGVAKRCRFLGAISYPLYMTHYAALWLFGHYYTRYQPGTTELLLLVPLGIASLVSVAYAVMRWYDIPVRRYLSRKRHPQ